MYSHKGSDSHTHQIAMYYNILETYAYFHMQMYFQGREIENNSDESTAQN